ncbi:hypothetical protein Z043_118064 [Scleropages formosus]|uniref:Uncharacterized protein n=1 Tax=Scleropages formosus TaxID=113540 RepID=A0A0N8JXG3_SCLFO|nr:hypothetical protein Z043_118064 [Scleropages formosus]
MLRMGELQLSRMGIAPKQQQEILQGVMLLRVQEELENINDIFSGQDISQTLVYSLRVFDICWFAGELSVSPCDQRQRGKEGISFQER